MIVERLVYTTEWYDTLVSDCKAMMNYAQTEAGRFLVRAKYEIGNRILPDYQRFGRSEYGNKTQRDLGLALGLRQERIGEFVRFAKKINEEYGSWEKAESSDLVATFSWKKIVHEWLPKTKRESVDPPPLPQGIYNIIYADPPWQYEFSLSERGDPKRYYPTLSTEDICALEVPVAEDAILFLWATNPKLEEAFEVIKAWGFEYRTNMVWIKDKIGTGYYFRGQHELLLVAKKGIISPPNESDRLPSVLISSRRKHSEKPVEVYDIIEKMYPDQNYLELFSRNLRGREGWTFWGLDLDP